eukprot:TRINITY_DN4394_c0_g1_i1.p1 TRINITY_DN4394_c0_g1~~TRINITY_DN4394_c0_g1_i1.p1  ORF type:complete len:188 (+),score=71.92 TRINITY_DN4394_c0_g1_i1:127-690(+)
MVTREEELIALRSVFDGMKDKYLSFDVGGEGIITTNQFRRVLEEVVGEECPQQEWDSFISSVDLKNTGFLSFQDFLFALFLWYSPDSSMESEGKEENQEEEKDEVEIAFSALKRLFIQYQIREERQEIDRRMDLDQFKVVLEQCSSTPISWDFVNQLAKIITSNSSPKDINFRQFIHGMYLFFSGEQ